ncbi:MAG: tRNA adenosine deaminase, partial [Mycobacterium sp.]|nr:tRNA adenosine deaminase [Mycobacterium sp.]
GVLGVIISDDDMEIDEQITAIAERMGFENELSAVLDKLGR